MVSMFSRHTRCFVRIFTGAFTACSTKSEEKAGLFQAGERKSWLRLLSQKRFNRVSELKAVVGEQVVLAISFLVILQER